MKNDDINDTYVNTWQPQSSGVAQFRHRLYASSRPWPFCIRTYRNKYQFRMKWILNTWNVMLTLYHLHFGFCTQNSQLNTIRAFVLPTIDDTMALIYSFWRHNHFITFNKCKKYIHTVRHIIIVIIQPHNNWCSVDSASQFIPKAFIPMRTARRIKCSVKFTLAARICNVHACLLFSSAQLIQWKCVHCDADIDVPTRRLRWDDALH